MKNVLVLIMIGLLFSCNKKEGIAKEDSVVQKPYVISLEDKKNIERDKKNNVPSPFIPAGISMENNLIIDEHSNIYYYQTNYMGRFCAVGMEYDTIPRFINLNPKDLIKIPKACIGQFIDENVMTNLKNKRILIVASQNDSIKDLKFLSFYKNTKVPMCVIRRTTQEEDTVLKYKKEKRYYIAESIKWDITRIKFSN